MTLEVRLYQDEDGIWIAEVPSLPGCFSDGPTEAEALLNVQEAARACLDVRRERGLPVPPVVRIVQIAV